MSSTMSGNHGESKSLGSIIFKDLGEAMAFARAKRSEYFTKLFRSWHRGGRSKQGDKGHMEQV